MENSIQEYLKKINSTLRKSDLVSLFITTALLLIIALYFFIQGNKNEESVTYTEGVKNDTEIIETRPFGSISGTTYTFSWCQNSSAILAKNRIYFKDEEGAKKSGRTLSKLCEK